MVPNPLTDCPQDPEAAAKREDWAYAGPYVNRWDLALQKRRLELDERGVPVPVSARQHAMFGVQWSRQWQDRSAPSAGDDALQHLGPGDEVAEVDVRPPAGSTWAEVVEMQKVEKRGYEKGKAKERRARERKARLEMVRRFFRRLGRAVGISKARGRSSGAEGEAVPLKKGLGVAETRVDSGRASTVAGE